MNEALSRLRSIEGFEAARFVETLSDGPTNSSYRVDRNGEAFVLRLDKPRAAELGMDRGNESLVLRHLAAAGFADEPEYCEPDSGILLRPFIGGRSWTTAELQDPDRLARLAGLLRSLHKLPAVGKVFDPVAAAGRYAGLLDSVEAGVLADRIADIGRTLRAEGCPPVLCHNDLVCGNIIEGDTLRLIDWEYAAAGDPWFDLAVVVQHHGLDRALTKHFVETWLNRPAKVEEWSRLELMCRFYQHLLELWNLASSRN